MEQCQLTHIARTSIDIVRARLQHQQYCQALRRGGIEVRTLDAHSHLPDCAFVEDTAIVLDEVAVLASMGCEARRPELRPIEAELTKYRELQRIEPPALIEGGDVLVAGHTLLVGLSSRTGPAGAEALQTIVRPYGYRVVTVPVRGCLHLKTACGSLGDRTLLINPAWIDPRALRDFRLACVPADEPWAANVLHVGERRWIAAGQPRTAALLRELGYDVDFLEVSEFAKAEGGVTCLSIVLGVESRESRVES